MRQGRYKGRSQARGLTLIEVMISIAVVTVIILASLMVRYYAVRHAVRADAYNTAARIGQLFLEGWRSTELTIYEPYARLHDQLPTIASATAGPGLPEGFTMYISPPSVYNYMITMDGIQFYVTMGYMNPVTTENAERPPVLHVAVGFMERYGAWDDSGAQAVVRLTTIK